MQVAPLWPRSKAPPKMRRNRVYVSRGSWNWISISMPPLPGNLSDPEFFAKDPRSSIISPIPSPTPCSPCVSLCRRLPRSRGKNRFPVAGRYRNETKHRRKWVLERNFPAARLCGYEAPDIRLLLRFAAADWLYDARVTFSPAGRFRIVVLRRRGNVALARCWRLWPMRVAELEKLEIRSGEMLDCTS